MGIVIFLIKMVSDCIVHRASRIVHRASYAYLSRYIPTSRVTLSLTPIGYFLLQLLYIPLVIYVPALAFNQVTGLNLHAIALLVCAVCIFYTTLVREMRKPKETR